MNATPLSHLTCEYSGSHCYTCEYSIYLFLKTNIAFWVFCLGLRLAGNRSDTQSLGLSFLLATEGLWHPGTSTFLGWPPARQQGLVWLFDIDQRESPFVSDGLQICAGFYIVPIAYGYGFPEPGNAVPME